MHPFVSPGNVAGATEGATTKAAANQEREVSWNVVKEKEE